MSVVGYGYQAVRAGAIGSSLHNSYEAAAKAVAFLNGRDVTWGHPKDLWEVERVWMYENGNTNYELIRGGRWVNWWEAQYGRHAKQSKEKIRSVDRVSKGE